MWAICERCHGMYLKDSWRDTQRFCCRTCSRLYRYHGPAEMDDKLRGVAERCHRFIVNAGDAKGVSGSDLARYIGDAYRNLDSLEREFVHLWVSKRNDVAHMVSGDSWRFWPRGVAPEEAVRV